MQIKMEFYIIGDKAQDKDRMNLKFFLFLIILLFIQQPINSQLFLTKQEVIKKYGCNYQSGIADENIEYIQYDKQRTTVQSGEFTEIAIYYFIDINDKKDICYMAKFIDPSSEANNNVAFMKSLNYIEMGELKWKDYENNVIYKIEIKPPLCVFEMKWGIFE